MIYKWADASCVWSLILRYLPEDNLHSGHTQWEGCESDIRTDLHYIRTDFLNVRTDLLDSRTLKQ